MIFSTPNQIAELRARMNMVAIRTYLSCGMRVTRIATNDVMLSIASETTGVDYRKGKSKATKKMLAQALADLETLFRKPQSN